MNKINLSIILLALFAAVALSATAKLRYKTRSISIMGNGNSKFTKISSIFIDNNSKNGTISTFVIAGAPLGDLRIRSTFITFDSANKQFTRTSFRTRFIAIIEYLDTDNSNNGFALNTDGSVTGDTIVSTYKIGVSRKGFGSNAWVMSDVTVPADTINGIYSLKANTNDNVFTVQLDFSNQPQTDASGNIVASPAQAKFSVTINGFPYQDSTLKSRLALVTRVESASTAVYTNSDPFMTSITVTKQVQFGSEATLTWSNQVSVTDNNGLKTTAAVVATSPVLATNVKVTSGVTVGDNSVEDDTDLTIPGEQSSILIFSFMATQPAIIYWDPTMGPSSTVDSEGTSGTATGSTASLIPSFMVVLVASFLFFVV